MADLNEFHRLVQACREFIGEISAAVGAFVDGVVKAESALIGGIAGLVRDSLEMLKEKAGEIRRLLP